MYLGKLDPQMHYPQQSYDRLYDPTAGELWQAKPRLPLEEDGDHSINDPEYFEWWYFDAICSNGINFVAVIHSSPFNSTIRDPLLDLRITLPDGESSLSLNRYERRAFHSDRSSLQIGPSSVRVDTEGQYHLHLTQEDISIRLVYQPCVPGWRAGTGQLFSDPASGRFFRWDVPIPNAYVSGQIEFDGVQLEVKGRGYHDHNRGNLNLASIFKRWYWGRAHLNGNQDDCLFVFGDLLSKVSDSIRVTPLVLFRSGEVVERPREVHIDLKQTAIEPGTSVQYPSSIQICADWDHFGLEFNLQVQRTLAAEGFASPRFHILHLRKPAEILYYTSRGIPIIGSWFSKCLGEATYLRFNAAAQMEIVGERGGVYTGEAIFEYMKFH